MDEILAMMDADLACIDTEDVGTHLRDHLGPVADDPRLYDALRPHDALMRKAAKTLYLTATLATAFSWSFGSFSLFRALTGAGIGGEYAAINSAVDELIPGRVRGHVDLGINATFWLGAALGAGASLLLLNTTWIPPTYSWRLAFGLGGAIAGRPPVPDGSGAQIQLLAMFGRRA